MSAATRACVARAAGRKLAPVRLLVIDTSSVVSVALLDVPDQGAPAPGAALSSPAATVLASFVGADTHRHAEDLVPAVRSALSEAGWVAPEAIVVGEGPGPFTGLRVGLATAQTLGFAWGVPVWGLCSLDGLAHQVRATHPELPEMLVALDARRKELYWGRYAADGTRLDGPHVGAVDSLPTGIALAGAGASVRAEQIFAAGLAVIPGTESLPVDAAHLGLAWAEQGCPESSPQARYLRESDAVVPGSMAGVDVSSARQAGRATGQSAGRPA